MTEDKPRSESEIPGALTQVMEKVSDIRFALIVVSAFVALDIGLIIGTKSSALTYAWGDLNAARYKELLLVFLAYLCWMAIFSKGLRPLAEEVARPCARLIFRRGSDSSSYEQYLRYGRVPVHEAKEEALTEENEFWIKRVDAAESEADAQKNRMDSLAGLSFSTVCLAAVDLGLAPKSFAGELIALFNAGNHLVVKFQ